MNGIGLYWCIIECLYENNGYLDLEQLDLLAYELRVEKCLIEKLINDYNLFKKNKERFYSKSVLQRLEKINEISNKNKENVRKRWEKEKTKKQIQANNENNTVVVPSNYKEKENKIKENKNKRKENDVILTTNIYEYIENNFGRSISPIEYEKINSWLLTYKQELIEKAVEISVINAKKTFNYVEGILKTWKGKNLETLDQVEEEQQRFNQLKYQQPKEKVELFDYDWLNDDE